MFICQGYGHYDYYSYGMPRVCQGYGHYVHYICHGYTKGMIISLFPLIITLLCLYAKGIIIIMFICQGYDHYKQKYHRYCQPQPPLPSLHVESLCLCIFLCLHACVSIPVCLCGCVFVSVSVSVSVSPSLPQSPR